jgi:hypothetical protein
VTKNRFADPSKICALDFIEEFRRFGLCLVSATIGINRSIPEIPYLLNLDLAAGRNTVSTRSTALIRSRQPTEAAPVASGHHQS